MKRLSLLSISTAIALGAASVAQAGVCAYAPSKMIGAAAAGTAATGATMKALGLYTIMHSTSGAAMIGSTAAGTSAAGTVGIIAGSGGLLGGAAAILMSPAVIVGAGATAVAAGALEGGCYLMGSNEE